MVSMRPSNFGKPNPHRKHTSNYDAHCECGDCDEWESNEGPIPVCQMADRHLQAAKTHLESGAWGERNEDEAYDWIDKFDKELERRGLA